MKSEMTWLVSSYLKACETIETLESKPKPTAREKTAISKLLIFARVTSDTYLTLMGKSILDAI